MLKALSVCLIAILLLSSTVVYAKGPGDKLVRGAGNILSGWLEVPQTIGEEWKTSNNAAVGMFTGLFKGLCLWGVRTISGFWDVVSFPVPLPKDYEPLYKPDYVFDKE